MDDFVRESNPGPIDFESISLPTVLTMYPHDIASEKAAINSLLITVHY